MSVAVAGVGDDSRRTVLDRVVRLGDVAPTGRLRLDALATYLQDVADDDAARWTESGAGPWVLRKMAIEIERLPAFRDGVRLETWCSQRGGYWAERSTRVESADRPVASARAIWVHVDDAGRPRRVPEWFAARFTDLVAESPERSRTATRLTHAALGPGATPVTWSMRAVDLDVLDHANNTVTFAAVEEVVARLAPGRPIVAAEAEYSGAIVRDERVRLTATAHADRVECWLAVDGEVRTSAVVRLGPAAEPRGPDHARLG